MTTSTNVICLVSTLDSIKPCKITTTMTMTITMKPARIECRSAESNESRRQSRNQRKSTSIFVRCCRTCDLSRPMEISSKRRPTKRDLLPVHLRGKRKLVDPRFSEDYGEYNAREFRQSYQFITDIRRQELTVRRVTISRSTWTVHMLTHEGSTATIEILWRCNWKVQIENCDQSIGKRTCSLFVYLYDANVS
jgi:hypothetical protein